MAERRGITVDEALAILQQCISAHGLVDVLGRLKALGEGYSTLTQVATTLKTFLQGVKVKDATIKSWREIEKFLATIEDADGLTELMRRLHATLEAEIVEVAKVAYEARKEADGLSDEVAEAHDLAEGALKVTTKIHHEAEHAHKTAHEAIKIANDAYHQADSAYIKADEALVGTAKVLKAVKTVEVVANRAYAYVYSVSNVANAAYNRANEANTTATEAYTLANSVSGIANNANATATEAMNIANGVSGIASDAMNTANDAVNTANSAYSLAGDAYNRANSAYNQANSAYNAANDAQMTADEALGIASNAVASVSASGTSPLTLEASRSGNAVTISGSVDLSDYATTESVSDVYNTVNVAYNTANEAYAQANNAYDQANTAYTTATNAYNQANAAYNQANSAYNQANSAYNQANSANSLAQQAYNQANAANTLANSANALASTANTTATSAYSQANNAYNTANSAYAQANNAYNTANDAYNTANDAYNAANAAQATADSKQDKLTAGTGIEITSDSVINVTLDTTIVKVVTALPDEPDEADKNKIFLVPSAKVADQNIYTEYLWVNDAWEKLGEYSTDVDLSDYLTKEEIENTYATQSAVANVSTTANAAYDIANSTLEQLDGVVYYKGCQSYTFVGGDADSVVVIDGAEVTIAAGATVSGIYVVDISSFATNNLKEIYINGNFTAKLSSSSGSNDTVEKIELTYRNGYEVDMACMFYMYTALQSLSITCSTSSCTDMNGMFREGLALETLDLSTFDTSKVTEFNAMFRECYALTNLYLGDNWDMGAAATVANMFHDCQSLTNVTGTISNIKLSMDLSYSPLTRESALVFINGLSSEASGQTLSLSDTTKALLTDEDIKIATDKGWTIE